MDNTALEEEHKKIQREIRCKERVRKRLAWIAIQFMQKGNDYPFCITYQGRTLRIGLKKLQEIEPILLPLSSKQDTDRRLKFLNLATPEELLGFLKQWAYDSWEFKKRRKKNELVSEIAKDNHVARLILELTNVESATSHDKKVLRVKNDLDIVPFLEFAKCKSDERIHMRDWILSHPEFCSWVYEDDLKLMKMSRPECLRLIDIRKQNPTWNRKQVKDAYYGRIDRSDGSGLYRQMKEDCPEDLRPQWESLEGPGRKKDQST